MHFPHSATIQRTVETNGKYIYSTTGTSACFLQPLSMEDSQTFGMTFGKSSACFLPFATDVKDGDRLVINSTTYGVRGAISRDYGTVRHKKAILEAL